MMSRRRGLVGLSIAAVIAVAATVLAVGVGSANSGDTGGSAGGDGFCADLPDAIGLYVGNPVTQMGYRVGKVTKIEAQGDHVRVTFSLDGGRSYPADVQAVTRSKSLLADRSVELVGNYRGGPVLTAGHCISKENSFTPKSISEITGSASDFLKSLSDNGSPDLQGSLDGIDKALAGTGNTANSMFEHASAAAKSPDDFVANIGSAIANMAPLTQNALQDWGSIMSILNQMPTVAAKGTTLFGDVSKFDVGVGWTVATVYDIQRNYGSIIWPIVQGPVKDLIALAAARAPDLQKLYAMVPSISAALNQQESAGGLSVPYRAPGVALSAAQCSALRVSCDAGRTTTMNLFTLLLDKAGQ
ncbi:MlaD family protein [Gordonia polyisoprenivorans]|uniref:MlaD family protein n=1 Tax=Gordonia polyisoprenivorans TaxID=84595 RepID=UPI001AD7D110|nr:MlaD family protein [Gordonia polyisoprenivorans]QTI70873.1 MCE family protein [Gordonia polyisoprenivorans]